MFFFFFLDVLSLTRSHLGLPGVSPNVFVSDDAWTLVSVISVTLHVTTLPYILSVRDEIVHYSPVADGMHLSNGRPLSALVGRYRSPAYRRSLCTRVVNDVLRGRGDYARVTDADMRHFRSLLGEPNVLTGAQNLGPYNVDYVKHVSGKPSQRSHRHHGRRRCAPVPTRVLCSC